jgi:hypothetical protein
MLDSRSRSPETDFMFSIRSILEREERGLCSWILTIVERLYMICVYCIMNFFSSSDSQWPAYIFALSQVTIRPGKELRPIL